MEIATTAQNWVHHDRGGKEPTLIRKFQKLCWDALFPKKDKKVIVHDLNNKYLPCDTKLIVFDMTDPIEAYNQLKELFQVTEYDIDIFVKPNKR